MMDIIHDTIASPFNQLVGGAVSSDTVVCSGQIILSAIQSGTPTQAYNSYEANKIAFGESLKTLVEKFNQLD